MAKLIVHSEELKLHRAKVDSAIQKREANNLARARAEAKKLADEYGFH